MVAGQEQEKSIAAYPLSATAIKSIAYSRKEAITLHNGYLHDEHLILGLLKTAEENEGITTHLFDILGIDRENRERLWIETARKMPKGNSASIELTPTPLYIKILKLAAEETKRSGENEIRPIHILIGLIRQGISYRTYKILPQNNSGINQVERLRDLARNKSLMEADTPKGRNE